VTLAKQELRAFYVQIAEQEERAGNLWLKVDGASKDAQRCFTSAAACLERASDVLEKAAAERVEFLAKLPEEGDTDGSGN
jgi:hypothetical protein